MAQAAAILEGAGTAIQAITGAAGMAQGAHENAVQYQQDATTGADARRQNERLLTGPGQFSAYSQNIDGTPYMPPGGAPQFTDGAPQQSRPVQRPGLPQPQRPQPGQQQPVVPPDQQQWVMTPQGMKPMGMGPQFVDGAVSQMAQGQEQGFMPMVMPGPGMFFQQPVNPAAYGGMFGAPVFFDDGAPPQQPQPRRR